jgi:hypothetical protein
MAGPALNSTLIAQAAIALYNSRLGNATMTEALAISTPLALGSVAELIDSLLVNDPQLNTLTNAQLATRIAANLGVPTAFRPVAESFITGVLNAAPAADRGNAILSVINVWSTYDQQTTDASLDAAVAAFRANVAASVSYSQTVGTLDFDLGGGIFNLDSSVAGVMRLTGNQHIRIDITRRTD